MELLPPEIIINILTQHSIGVEDVFNFASTCSHFLNLVKHNDVIWRRKYKQIFPRMLNQLNHSHTLFYEEFLYIRSLHLRAKALLEKMSISLHQRIELGPGNFTEWDEMLKEKANYNYYYIADYLMTIVNSKAEINTTEIVPFNTPGNLTRKHYALKVLRHMHRKFLTGVFQSFGTKLEKDKLLEEGAVFVAQWCQPNTLIDTETIHEQLDELTELVKFRVKIFYPTHPLIQATPEQFALWRREVKKSQEWKAEDSLSILKSINRVLFSYEYYQVSTYIQDPFDLNDMYIDQVLKLKKGSPELVAIIYQAIARRLGVYLEPILQVHRFILGYSEDPNDPGSMSLKINIWQKGHIVEQGLNFEVYPGQPLFLYLTFDQLLSRLSDQVGAMFDAMYEESDDSSACLGFLELKVLVNPDNSQDLIRLLSIYLQYGFDNEEFENILKHNCHIRSTIRSKKAVPVVERPISQTFRDTDVKSQAIKYAVGMIIRHKLYRYRGVIFNWDAECVSSTLWKEHNSISKLTFKDQQPFYNVLVEDGTHRYVAQENICLEHAPDGLKVAEEKLGKFFTHFCETHYVPNEQVDYQFPGDGPVRRYYRNVILNLPATTS